MNDRKDLGVGGPRYARLARRDVRLTWEQSEALTALRMKLNRLRGPGVGERITDNTLIRVAVTLLLARGEAVTGYTEAELLRSLGLPEDGAT